MDPIADKAGIRQMIRARRGQISSDELRLMDEELVLCFKERMEQEKKLMNVFKKASVIAVYKAVGGELPCDALASFFRQEGKRTVYPRVKKNNMSFCEISDPDWELIPGSFGIPEPRTEATAVDDEEIDIVIMPGIAFDMDGGRVGQGKGFYDRWLAKLPSDSRPLLIGVCMDFQLFPKVPTCTTDIPVDMILCL
ncbi:MAG: 5-formyltetrahydrofolate cyclo-ligase [Clostridiales bacterium]|nr:5-formyltetrahydrofolate cyclo-ligase [Clostridiales bacterium]